MRERERSESREESETVPEMIAALQTLSGLSVPG